MAVNTGEDVCGDKEVVCLYCSFGGRKSGEETLAIIIIIITTCFKIKSMNNVYSILCVQNFFFFNYYHIQDEL